MLLQRMSSALITGILAIIIISLLAMNNYWWGGGYVIFTTISKTIHWLVKLIISEIDNIICFVCILFLLFAFHHINFVLSL